MASVEQALAQTSQRTGKADESDPNFLQTALLLCKLSEAVYDANEIIQWESEVLQQALRPVSGQIAHFKPRLVYSYLAEVDTSFQDLGRQYAIWRVKGLGVVVAFRGTKDPQDMLADLDFQPSWLSAGEYSVHLHGGIFQAAERSCDQLANECITACRDEDGNALPLFLTGVSLEQIERLSKYRKTFRARTIELEQQIFRAFAWRGVGTNFLFDFGCHQARA